MLSSFMQFLKETAFITDGFKRQRIEISILRARHPPCLWLNQVGIYLLCNGIWKINPYVQNQHKLSTIGEGAGIVQSV